MARNSGRGKPVKEQAAPKLALEDESTGTIREMEEAAAQAQEAMVNPGAEATELAPETEEQPKATFTREQVDEIVRQAVEAALASRAPQVVQVSADTEKVQFLFQAEVSDDNDFLVGPGGMYGRVHGKTGRFSVPKGELSRAMDGLFRLLLENRWIICLSGLTDEEREAYGVDYKEGELLDRRAFNRMVELGQEILDIYPKLCKGHREMVAKRFWDAWSNPRNPAHHAVRRDVVVELNRMSKSLGSEKGDFAAIVQEMNMGDLEG